MDRVRAGLCAALTLLAGWNLLAGQGARLGSLVVPTTSWWWVAAAAVVLVLLSRRGQPILGGSTLTLGIALAISFLLLALWRSASLSPALGIPITANGETLTAPSLQLAERRELRRLVGRRRNVDIEASAILVVPRTGRYRLDIYCDDSCELAIGDLTVEASGEVSRELDLVRGDTPFRLHYRQEGGPASLLFSWQTPRSVELLPIEYFLRAPDEGDETVWRRVSAHAALACTFLWWCGFSLYLVHLGGRWEALARSRALPMAAAATLILYGCVLRLEALLAHSGLANTSAEAASLHETILPFTPPYAIFNPENAPEDPYRADVRSYLDRAESMNLASFYEASFREPFYVLLTKPFLWLSGAEVGILVQSFFFSCLTLPLFYVVAKSVHGPRWAVALLAPVTLHAWLILEAPTGYRMSAYAFFLLAFWWSLSGSMTGARALGVGLLAGLTSLIRLSASSAIVPLVALRVWSAREKRRWVYGATIASVAVFVVAPFLWSNYRAHGDPLYSISFHTEFWLRAEGLDQGQGPVSLGSYVTDFGHFRSLIRGTIAGMTILPLRTFWNGLRPFLFLDIAVTLSGVLGLMASLTSSKRSLLVAYLGHLLPFAYIQNFPSGEMPRFVMPAYLFLVLAAPIGVETLARLRTRPSRQ